MGRTCRLSQSVYGAKVDSSYILLDITRDRYLYLTDQQSSWLDDILCHAGRIRDLPPPAVQFSEALRRQSLLDVEYPGFTNGLKHEPPHARHSWLTLESDCKIRPGSPAFLRMAYAVSACWWLERRSDFAGVVSEARRWKAGCTGNQPPAELLVRSEVAAFRRMSPYFFSSREACRFRSLALIKFLTTADIAADWVFAVRLAPFAAHCWIEWEGHVLNEHLDRTFDYREIMRV